MQLVRKGKRKGHIRERWPSKNRVIYRWMGIPPEPAAKEAAATIRRSLLTLEFVIYHWGKFQFYLCPDQKRELLLLPESVQSPANVEEFITGPVFREKATIGFCFVDEGQAFQTWFERRAALFTAIGKVIVVYISAHKKRVKAAGQRVADFISRAQDVSKITLLHTLKSRFDDKFTRAFMTPDEIRQYKQLVNEYRPIAGAMNGPVRGLEIAINSWWDPASNRHQCLFESLPSSESESSIKQRHVGS